MSPNQKWRLYKWACALLLGVSLSLIALPLAPAIEYHVQEAARTYPVVNDLVPSFVGAPDAAIPTEGDWLVIPVIHVKERLWEGDSLAVLDTHTGAWHQTGEISGNFVIAGHRFQYLPPNTQTFYNLNKLLPDDPIILVLKGVSHTYKVQEARVVAPDHVEILNPTPTPQLTLYTCNDAALTRRYVVIAVPVVS